MLTLHPLLGDHAVLQCEKPLIIRGTAYPNATITVKLAATTATTPAGPDGTWALHLPAFPPGGPYTLVVESGTDVLRTSGLMLGEVWLCSGQSNMEWTLDMLNGLEADIAEADDPLLRCFTIARLPSDKPTVATTGCWQMTTPKTARDFSATAYFFARRLRATTGRAIGVIVSAVGGSMIASWLPREILTSRPEYKVFAEDNNTSCEATESICENFTPHSYQERGHITAGWESPELDDSSWGTLPVPSYWQDQGLRHNGAVWYRRTVELPAKWAGHELIFELGPCDDFDEAFVNGVRVGGLGPESPNAYAMRRIYPVPAALVADGRATIAVRVFDRWGNGGITGGAQLRLAAERDDKLVLSGSWKAKMELALPLRAPKSGLPPAVLFNGMIHPLVGCGLRGFLWYQGESDVPRAALYRVLLSDLIEAWRSLWGDPLLPFGLVQLANYQTTSSEPGESDWAELRDAQLLAARNTERAGLAVAIDVGEADNIHPKQKRPVGERLARWALATIYGQPESPWSSPIAVDHWRDHDAIFVRFMHVGDGLRSRSGQPLQGLQIATANQHWRWAEAAVVQRDVIRISSVGMNDPVAVRYAWQANPRCTLENSTGLPASPFRTDDWPLTTLR